MIFCLTLPYLVECLTVPGNYMLLWVRCQSGGKHYNLALYLYSSRHKLRAGGPFTLTFPRFTKNLHVHTIPQSRLMAGNGCFSSRCTILSRHIFKGYQSIKRVMTLEIIADADELFCQLQHMQAQGAPAAPASEGNLLTSETTGRPQVKWDSDTSQGGSSH